MGQCVTIEVSRQGKEASQINSHHDLAKHPNKEAKNQKVKRAESSDDETSEDEAALENEAADKFAVDENFGKAQSPINVITCSGPNCAKIMSSDHFRSNPLKLNYPEEIRGCTIMNTGHTVQVNIPSHSKCSLNIYGKTYNLVQFHFHTPAEHLIDSKHYEMEMHLVHATENGELAVIGFIFTANKPYFKTLNKLAEARAFLVKKSQEILKGYGKEDPVHQDDQLEDEEDEEAVDAEVESPGKEEEVKITAEERRRSSVRQQEGNDFLAQFWDDLPLKKTEQDIPLAQPLSFDYLFEAASKTFKRSVENNEIELDMEIFEYDGSLTTPPYSEGVQWLLAKKIHFINAKQLNKLSSCWGHHANNRECQHYHGRTVELRPGVTMKGYFFQ